MQQRQTEYRRIERTGLLSEIRAAARANGIPLAVLLAVGSRESRLGGALSPDCTGDGGQALTIWQIDRRFHPDFAARTDPCDHAAGARYAAELLARNRAELGTLRKAVAAYNAGRATVRDAVARGAPLDSVTTGDYVADVERRAAQFEELTRARAGLSSGGVLLAAGGVAAALYSLSQS